MPAITKIDVQELLKMNKRGYTRRELAEHFGVSTTAINKRLKRLQAHNTAVLDKHDLTDREKQFVIEKASGKSNSVAARNAYDVSTQDSAKSLGSTLMKKPEIRGAIDDLMEANGLGREYRVNKLKEFVDHVDPNIGLKALQMAMKAGDDFPQERHNINVQGQIFSIHKILQEIEREERSGIRTIGEPDQDETLEEVLYARQKVIDADTLGQEEGGHGEPPQSEGKGNKDEVTTKEDR